jgi:AraC-like DNA-binding protein
MRCVKCPRLIRFAPRSLSQSVAVPDWCSVPEAESARRRALAQVRSGFHPPAFTWRTFASLLRMEYIAQHLDEDITVAQLAGVACLSPFHFVRMFRAAMGVAPHRYVSQQRLERPMALLAADKRSLIDIAFGSQFSSQASFNRAFRRATGVTPGEYRRAGR